MHEAFKFELRGRVYTVINDKPVTHAYAVSYTDMNGVDTVRVSNGHADSDLAMRAMRSFLRALDKKNLPGSGRVVALQPAAEFTY